AVRRGDDVPPSRRGDGAAGRRPRRPPLGGQRVAPAPRLRRSRAPRPAAARARDLPRDRAPTGGRRAPGAQRRLVLGPYRETELRQAAAAARVLGDLARSSHRLTLTGLTGDDVAQYVLATYGRAPAPEAVEAILRATEGNAFFVTEVVQLLIT